MELRQLEYFVAVARDGTYTAAAERLHVAQPALWKQVRDLERELDVALFERVGRRVRITSAGSLLLERAEQLVVGTGRLRVLADDLRLGRTGRVRVRCFAPHIARFLAGVIATFRDEHPGISVELAEHGLDRAADLSMVDALHLGAADVITTSRVPEATDLDGFAAYQVNVVVLPASRAAAAPIARSRSRLEVAALEGIPLVTSPRGYFSRERLEAACGRLGFEPRIEAESTSPSALVALADEGVGTAVAADDGLSPDRPVLRLTNDGAALSDEVWLYRHAERRDPSVDLFFAAARAAPKYAARR